MANKDKKSKSTSTALVPAQDAESARKLMRAAERRQELRTADLDGDPVERVIGELADTQQIKTKLERAQKKQLDLQTRVSLREAAPRRVAVDVAGSSIAQVSTELLNWGVRALGKWSGPDGFWGRNVDLAQGVPHFLLGLGLYTIEMLDRRSLVEQGELPSAGREVLNEAAKLFGQLGLSTTVRALRVRYLDGKTDREQSEIDRRALAAERDLLKAQLAELQKPQKP